MRPRYGMVGAGWGVLLSGALLCAGCGTVAGRYGPAFPEEWPRRAEVEGVPFYFQADHQCGPAALAMVFGWNGLDVDPAALSAEVYTPGRKGTLQYALISGARRHGLLACPLLEARVLLEEIAAGRPVIVLMDVGYPWRPRWHYAVAVGYDLADEVIILHTGKTPASRIPLRVFERGWSRGGSWGLVVLDPTRLPVSAEEGPFLDAVLGLEQAGQRAVAATGYRTALARWPDSTVASMGLGNCLHALGDIAGAEGAFRRACRQDPALAPAWNNLAQVLFEQGRLREAAAAASMAVALGGPLADIYAETLAGIEHAREGGRPPAGSSAVGGRN